MCSQPTMTQTITFLIVAFSVFFFNFTNNHLAQNVYQIYFTLQLKLQQIVQTKSKNLTSICNVCKLIRAPDTLRVLRIIKNNFSYVSTKNIDVCCDPSSELPQGYGFNDWSQISLYGEIWIIIPKITITSSYLEHCFYKTTIIGSEGLSRLAESV